MTASLEMNWIMWGQTTGSGAERTYVTKPGDTLEDIATCFYGGVDHCQRLIDDHPDLGRWEAGAQVSDGTRISVSEVAAHDAAIAGAPKTVE